MKILQLTAAALLLGAQSLMAQAPTFEWAISLSNSTSSNSIFSVTTDMAGNVYSVGSFSGVIDFDPSANTVNLDAANGSTFILKHSPTGDLLWAKQSTAEYYLHYANGAIYATGAIYGTADINPSADTTNLTSVGVIDGFVAKFDTAMTTIDWHRVISGTNIVSSNMIRVTADNKVYIGGGLDGTMDADPGPNTVSLTGAANSSGDLQLYGLMLDNNGNFLWAKLYPQNTNSITITDVIVTDTSLYVCIEGRIDTLDGIALPAGGPGTAFAALAKLNPSTGTAIWAKTFGGATAILPRANGNIVLVFQNRFTGTADYDPSPAVANFTHAASTGVVWITFDPNGNFVSVNGFGSQTGVFVTPQAASTDYLGNIYMLGTYSGAVDFDPTSATNTQTSIGSANSPNIFLMSISEADTLNFVEVSDSGSFFPGGLHLDNRGNIFTFGRTNSAGLDLDLTAGTAYYVSSAPGVSQAYLFKMTQPTFVGVTENAVVASAKLFPNPAAHVINIENAVIGSQLRVTDALGRVVLQARINNENSQIATDALSNGLYFFQIQQADSKVSEMHKVIIAK